MKKRKKYILRKHYKGQVWVETVIYTLIAFIMIGLVLSYARPKIQELQDHAILQQSTEMMKQIDSKILTLGSQGNQRILEIGIKAGKLDIDGVNDKIIFSLESQSVYSEIGRKINDGNIVVLTEKKVGYNLVTLTRNYSSDYDITINGKNELVTISQSSTSYKLSISNGGVSGSRTLLNMSID